VSEDPPKKFRALSASVPDVAALVSAYLSRVDDRLPGRLTGSYLVGSVALGDYQPGPSDVDLVAVTDTSLAPTELQTLKKIHTDLKRIPGLPALDAVYITWPQLKSAPTGLSAPYGLNGRFFPAGGFAANPVTWATLHRYPLAVRGPAEPEVWHEDALLREWCRQNLRDYWVPWAHAARTRFVRQLVMLSRRARIWGVLGVARLHATIGTGDIISKSAAGTYALDVFPKEWSPVIDEALGGRIGRPAHARRSILSRRRLALAFIEFVISDACRL